MAQIQPPTYRFPRLAESAEDKDKLLAERAGLEAEAFRLITSYRKVRLQLGHTFIRIKATLKHGEWERYYEKTFGSSGVSFRSAQRYMRLAAKADADSKNDSLTPFKPGVDPHAVKVRDATEKARAAVGGHTPKPELVYRLSLHLSTDERDATDQLWKSPHRPLAEKEMIAVLKRLHIKFGIVNSDALKGEDADDDREAR